MRGAGGGRAIPLLMILAILLLAVPLGELAAQSARGGVTVPADARFVASSRGRVYYPVACDAWRDLSPANLLFFHSSGAAEDRGYRPTRNRSCRAPAELTPLPSRDADAQERPPGGATRCVVERVVDGDTLDCRGGVRVRLLLVDAPEMAQSDLGLRALLALEELVARGTEATLWLDVQERDRYGRVLAHVYRRDGVWVNHRLVRSGYAVPLVYPPNVWGVERIREAVREAQREGAGLWEERGFDCAPADFRRGRCGGAEGPGQTADAMARTHRLAAGSVSNGQA